MSEKLISPEAYLDKLPEDRRLSVGRIRRVLLDHLPAGFEEQISYGMLGYVVPHALYPEGYHVNPELPLPFIHLASQKNHVALYHMGLYLDKKLLDWFVEAYPAHSNCKLDMGKNCVRFKKMEAIPYDLIADLAGKITPQEWIRTYEESVKKS